jgi:hypothetical protein
VRINPPPALGADMRMRDGMTLARAF